MGKELNVKRIEEQRSDLILQIQKLEYQPEDSSEELLCSIILDKCPIPPQQRQGLIRLCFKLRDLKVKRTETFNRLDSEINDLCEWLEVSKPTSSHPHLSKKNLEYLEKYILVLKAEQSSKVDAIYEKKIKTLREYTFSLNERFPELNSTIPKLEQLQMIEAVIKTLKPKYEASAKIRSLIEERTNLIQRMKEFEVSASDPSRLFQPSFRLINEEKFRKSALPNLIKLEGKLKLELMEWKGGFAYQGSEDWLKVMEEEIACRYVNETIFGFKCRTQPVSSQSLPRSISKTDKVEDIVIREGTEPKNKAARMLK